MPSPAPCPRRPLDEIIQKVRDLDMDEIRTEIAKQKTS